MTKRTTKSTTKATKKLEVLTEKKIMQKMAGYKSAYTKMIKAAKTSKERKNLEAKKESYLASKKNEILAMNKKAVQQRAGFLSWETRKANLAKKCVCTKSTKKTGYNCKMGVKVSKKH